MPKSLQMALSFVSPTSRLRLDLASCTVIWVNSGSARTKAEHYCHNILGNETVDVQHVNQLHLCLLLWWAVLPQSHTALAS